MENFSSLQPLRNLFQKNELSSSWIIENSLKKDLFKEILEFCIAVLSTEVPSELVSKHIKSGVYPNLCVIQKPQDQEELKIEDIQPLYSFIYQSAVMPGWRIVVLDSIDACNRFASNAILKMLEEPPSKVLFLLMATSWSRVLPTIRSRCQRLRINPSLPKVSSFEGYAQGNIQDLEDLKSFGGESFVAQVLEMMEGKWNLIQSFAHQAKQDEKLLKTFSWLIPQLIYEKAKKNPQWAFAFQKISTFLRQARESHLDKGHIVLGCFSLIEEIRGKFS